MGEPAIQVLNVSKSFGTTVAVKAVDLHIEKGEFFSFLGPSGCGKTTLLRMIAGFERPTSGQILIAQRDMVNIPAHRRPVNMVFQSYALFPHLSVIDNVCFGLRSGRKGSRAEMLERAKRAIALVRLEHLWQRFPHELSGGQQQRIALARAIVNEPAVLLLDEPLSALDPQIREEMQGELARLQRELNMTFIMVTHDQSEALALSHRIAVFSKGNLEQVGKPEEVYATPKTEFVARFIGQSNVLPCIYEGYDGYGHTLRMADGSPLVVTAGGVAGAAPAAAAPCVVCVKPHAVDVQLLSDWNMIEDREGDVDFNSLLGKITYASYQGTITEYVVLCRDVPVRIERSNTAGSITLQVGDEVVVRFAPESGWLLQNEPAIVPAPLQEVTALTN